MPTLLIGGLCGGRFFLWGWVAWYCSGEMTTTELKQWAAQKRPEWVIKHATPGAMVKYGSSQYEVAQKKLFPHGIMIGIYDEPPSRHVDFINPRNLSIPRINQH